MTPLSRVLPFGRPSVRGTTLIEGDGLQPAAHSSFRVRSDRPDAGREIVPRVWPPLADLPLSNRVPFVLEGNVLEVLAVFFERGRNAIGVLSNDAHVVRTLNDRQGTLDSIDEFDGRSRRHILAVVWPARVSHVVAPTMLSQPPIGWENLAGAYRVADTLFRRPS